MEQKGKPTMSEQEKLKPCPWCKSKGMIYWKDSFPAPACSGNKDIEDMCPARSLIRSYKNEEDAIYYWNKRPKIKWRKEINHERPIPRR
jgi:hypothetical protein